MGMVQSPGTITRMFQQKTENCAGKATSPQTIELRGGIVVHVSLAYSPLFFSMLAVICELSPCEGSRSSITPRNLIGRLQVRLARGVFKQMTPGLSVTLHFGESDHQAI